MSKTVQDERVSALENELRVMREQHTAELAAIRDELREARAKTPPLQIPADATAEYRERLIAIDVQKRLVESINPHEFAKAQDLKTAEWVSKQDAARQAHWRELLTGQYGYLIVTETSPQSNEGHTGSMHSTCRVIFADGHNEQEARMLAYGKYARDQGWSRPHGYYYAHPLPDDQAETVRAEMLDIVEHSPSQDALTIKCVNFMAVHLGEKLAVEAEVKQKTQTELTTLPNRFQHHRPDVLPGINAPYDTGGAPGVMMLPEMGI